MAGDARVNVQEGGEGLAGEGQPIPPQKVPAIFSEKVHVLPPAKHTQLPVILIAVISAILCLFECVRVEGFPFIELQEQLMKESMSIMAG